MIKFITDREIYETVLLDAIPKAKKSVWIGTANIKDAFVKSGSSMVPLLSVLAGLTAKGVSVRLIFARPPGPAFEKDFLKYKKTLMLGLERIFCPRVHFKCVIVDGEFAYTGSANLTGAGMGAKSIKKRNFESGIITTDKAIIAGIEKQYNKVWNDSNCHDCLRKQYCEDYEGL